ncbi:MAG TPA: DUF4255 domain-containing protein [Candidatus Limnocylindrales bacterium]|nr:DUF4255 domain-containing protein [Candidatus Limnocylindrales bacterium]
MDESLRALVKKEALNGSKAEIAFDAPTREWAARRNAPAVDLYLYDIREDVERRQVVFEEVRNPEGAVIERRRPPRRYNLSYLITAWTQRPEDEHRLLSACLACFLRHESVPTPMLAGVLAEAGLPVYLTVALPPREDRSISDVWTAMGGELKPSLDLVVNMPLIITQQAPFGPPVREEPRIEVARPDGETESVSGRRRGKPAAKPRPLTLEETIRAGTKRTPGRTFTIRGLPRN